MGDLRDMASLVFQDNFEISVRRSKEHQPTIPKLGRMSRPGVPAKVRGPIVFDDEIVVQEAEPSYIVAPKVSKSNVTLESKPARKRGDARSYNYARVKAKGSEKYTDDELRYWYKELTNVTIQSSVPREKLIELHNKLRQ